MSKGRPRPVVAETGTMCVKCIRLLGMTSSGKRRLDSRKAQHHLKELSTEEKSTYTAIKLNAMKIILGLHFNKIYLWQKLETAIIVNKSTNH